MALAEREVKVVNDLGLHARPSSQFVELAAKFTSEISVVRDSMTVNGKSILAVMTLAAEKGASLTIKAEGSDAEEAVRSLGELVDRGFSE